MDESRSLDSRRSLQPDQLDQFMASKNFVPCKLFEDPAGMPPRQVFWISKQILQLMMQDAIDDWILRQIHWLWNDEVIAHGISWVHNVLWPNGTFFIKLRSTPDEITSQISGDESVRPSSFELQLEAAHRASDVNKMILGGAPTASVSLIGNHQYRKCARDIPGSSL